jgi:hypothetical protein
LFSSATTPTGIDNTGTTCTITHAAATTTCRTTGGDLSAGTTVEFVGKLLFKDTKKFFWGSFATNSIYTIHSTGG